MNDFNKHYKKIANDNHNYADSLYVLGVFLDKVGINKEDNYGSVNYFACNISDDMRGVKLALNQIEQYSNGNPNKYSKQHMRDGLGTVVRYLKNTSEELKAFEYKKAFVHMSDIQKNYYELISVIEYWLGVI